MPSAARRRRPPRMRRQDDADPCVRVACVLLFVLSVLARACALSFPLPVRFGELRNVGTGSCLARTLEAGNSTAELAVLEPCVIRDGEHQEGGCEQSWYLPRYQQHYYLPDFQPHIPRGERRRLRKKRRASREAGRAGKLLCWVLTHPESHALKAAAVHRTWGSRCDYLLFVTSADDGTLPVLKVEINGLEDRSKIWLKTKTAWMHIYEKSVRKVEPKDADPTQSRPGALVPAPPFSHVARPVDRNTTPNIRSGLTATLPLPLPLPPHRAVLSTRPTGSSRQTMTRTL